MNWREITRHLAGFETAVLTTVDPSGHPTSTRCRVRPDQPAGVLRVVVGTCAEVHPGPANLLCHSHDEQLGQLRSVLVVGELLVPDGDGQEVLLRPRRLVPGVGVSGRLGAVRFLWRSRRTAARYLRARGLPRPRVAWEEFERLRTQVERERRTAP